MKQIGVAIIGYGFMGRTHGYGIQNLPLFYPGLPFRAKVAAIASRKLESARQGADDLSAPFFTDDYAQAIARPDVDAVCVALPNDMHEEVALAALRAGKHIYMDKPLAVTLNSAKRIRDAWSQSGVVGHMAHHARFFPCVMRSKQLVEEGRIGRLLTVRASYQHSGSVGGGPTSWKQDAQTGGGVLLDLGSHALDMTAHLAGAPSRVMAAMQTTYPSRVSRAGEPMQTVGDDATYMILQWDNGLTGSLECSKIATGAMDEFSFELRGEGGALRFDLMEPNWLWWYDNARSGGPLGGERGFTRIECIARYPAPAGSFLPPTNAIGWVRAHMHCMYTFLNGVHEGKQTSPSIEDGFLTQRMMQAAITSNDTGCFADISMECGSALL